jgi:succinoglycan biosynthesis protein ExoA
MNSHFITIIMPVRNEARNIKRCLESVISQDYPSELLEIIVVDGMSDDITRKIIQQTIDQCKNSNPIRDTAKPIIRLIDNPGRIVSTALNIGIKEAKGEIIFRIDGHCEIGPDYIKKCLKALEKTGADNSGGKLINIGKGTKGQAIALAVSSPFGVGGARFRYTNKPGWVNTVFPGAYKRDVFHRIGLFDEELVRNQDDEFNFRLTQAGGKIWLDPSIKIGYYCRPSFKSLWRQYFQYGYYKVRVLQKRRSIPAFHFVPGGFSLAMALSAGLSLLTGSWAVILAVLSPYISANILSSLWAARHNWRTLPLLPVAFGTIHFSYGFGFLWGLYYWREKERDKQ